MRALSGTELKRFLRDYRRENRPDVEMAALLQSVEYPYNVGSIFRLADGAGLGELILTGITPCPPNPTISKVARAKDRSVNWSYEKDAGVALEELRARGYHIVALEVTGNSKPYYLYQYPQKTCLVVGHEDHGVTKATLSSCDAAVFIPMYGKGLSHNVHTALSIVVYHILSSPSNT